MPDQPAADRDHEHDDANDRVQIGDVERKLRALAAHDDRVRHEEPIG
jgi:hypothetical protein